MINGALAIVGMFVALMFGGFAGMWAIWPTAYRHGYAEGESDRHRHRRGDAQKTTLLRLPTAGRIPLDRLADPEPLPDEVDPWPALEPITVAVRQLDPKKWRFAGESEQGWAAEAAEYELLHQPEPEPEPELTDTGEMRALSAAWIEKMQGDSNEWIFTHLMRTSE